MYTKTEIDPKNITPEIALDILKRGNERFVNNLKSNRDLLQQINKTKDGQQPFATILSCMDSRTSAELIFDQGLGDIFSIRIAGNIVNEDIIGSMEFAVEVVKTKIVVVLGHTACGAIKGACDDVKLGSLTHLLEKIKPAIEQEKTITQNRTSANVDFVNKVTELNTQVAMKEIVKKSSIIKQYVDSKKITIVGGVYDIATGLVSFYE